MSEEKTVSNIVIRVLMDGTEEILGLNGMKALLNYAGLSYLIQNRPDYSFEKNYREDEFNAISSSFYNILGTSGAKAMFRLIGQGLGRGAINAGIYESFKELPGEEILFKMIEIYVMASGKGELSRDGDIFIYDNPRCSACKGVKDNTPVCTVLNGMFGEYLKWAGVEGMKVVETKCKAMGDDTCRWEIVPQQ